VLKFDGTHTGAEVPELDGGEDFVDARRELPDKGARGDVLACVKPDAVHARWGEVRRDAQHKTVLHPPGERDVGHWPYINLEQSGCILQEENEGGRKFLSDRLKLGHWVVFIFPGRPFYMFKNIVAM